MSRHGPTTHPDCPLCGQPMLMDRSGPGPDEYRCDCEDEPTEYGECLSCGYSGPVGGACDECGMEIGS